MRLHSSSEMCCKWHDAGVERTKRAPRDVTSFGSQSCPRLPGSAIQKLVFCILVTYMCVLYMNDIEEY